MNAPALAPVIPLRFASTREIAHAPIDPASWWLFAKDGLPVKLPAGAIGFRVRYWPARSRGQGELVRDARGVPVLVADVATYDAFALQVARRPGRYLLVPVGPRFAPVAGAAVATIVIPEASPIAELPVVVARLVEQIEEQRGAIARLDALLARVTREPAPSPAAPSPAAIGATLRAAFLAHVEAVLAVLPATVVAELERCLATAPVDGAELAEVLALGVRRRTATAAAAWLGERVAPVVESTLAVAMLQVQERANVERA